MGALDDFKAQIGADTARLRQQVLISCSLHGNFDNLSIRGITEFRLNRHVLLSEGKLGILEPEK